MSQYKGHLEYLRLFKDGKIKRGDRIVITVGTKPSDLEKKFYVVGEDGQLVDTVRELGGGARMQISDTNPNAFSYDAIEVLYRKEWELKK
ncbi:hypothetical protein KY345_06520 [Candidatus Woesearchaeota archaeon]|nr:hypothetical protein [Candidatus Woesearchaeota archaeon]